MMRRRKSATNVSCSDWSILNVRSASQTTTSLARAQSSEIIYTLPKSCIVPPPTSRAMDLISSIRMASNCCSSSRWIDSKEQTTTLNSCRPSVSFL